MATMTRTTTSRKAAFACRLVSAVVEINGVHYAAEPIPAGEEGPAAFRLSKMSGDGAVYDLVRRHDGRVTCDCPHYTARIEGLSEDLCKHGKALVELKLLPAPKPSMVPVSPDAPRPITREDRAAASAFGIALPAPDPEPCCDPLEAAPCGPCRVSAEWPAVSPESSADAPGAAEDAADDAAPDIDLDAPLPDFDDSPAGKERVRKFREAFAPYSDEARESIKDEPADFPDIDEADAWPEDAVVGLAPDAAGRLTLADRIALEVDRFRSWGNDLGDLLADKLGELLAEVEVTQAADVPTLLDRREFIPVNA